MILKRLVTATLTLVTSVVMFCGSVSASKCSPESVSTSKATEITLNKKISINLTEDSNDFEFFYFDCPSHGTIDITITDPDSDNPAYVVLLSGKNLDAGSNLDSVCSTDKRTSLYRMIYNHPNSDNRYYIVAWKEKPNKKCSYNINVKFFSDNKLGWYYDPVFDEWNYFVAGYQGTYRNDEWFQIDGKWYFFNKFSAMQTGWLNLGGSYYYLGTDGAMKTGWQKINGKWYFLNDYGVMVDGWQKLGSTWYYFNDGAMVTGWKSISGKYYYFNDSGAMQTGWLKSKNEWYYLNTDGSMATGWSKVGGVYYYFNNSGAMLKGWQELGSTWYYFKDSGEMATNWQKIDGSWYFFDNGAMVTGTKNIGGKSYNFNSDGVCLNP